MCEKKVMPHGRHIYSKTSDTEQRVHIPSLIMHYHAGNVYWDDVLTVHVSIFLTKKQIIIIFTKHPQYGFPFIT